MIAIASPLSGWVTPLAAVPDAAFAQAMLGDGIAVEPSEGVLRAPGDGTVLSVHPAGHAVTLALDSGPVLLLHIGLDTVNLGGAGFAAECRDGQAVKTGDALVTFDLAQLARRARSLVTPVIVTNGAAFRLVSKAQQCAIAAGEELLQVEAISGATAEVEAAAEAEAEGPLHERRLALPLAHGLHARPAARIAQLAKTFSARIEVASGDGRSASALSAVAMLSLSLRHGAELTLRAQGTESEAALRALAELIESGMGEHLPVVQHTVTQAESIASPDNGPLPDRITGVVAVAGTAIGPALLAARKRPIPPPDAADLEAEGAALQAAIAEVRTSLNQAVARGGTSAAIAEAHAVLLDDPELERHAHAQIAAGRSAGFAWAQAIEHFAAPLRAAADHRFAERVGDLEDLCQQVLAALAGDDPGTGEVVPGAVLVGEDLLPSHLMRYADAGLAGLASGGGGASSHVAIIAAGMGLPMLCALGSSVARIGAGTRLAIHEGALLHNPSEADLAAIEQAAAQEAELRSAALARAHDPAESRDGRHIEVYANLGNAEDAARAAAGGAEGCGLLRTEFLFLDRGCPPSRSEQQAAYQAVADALGPRPLVVRTLDIGADKPVPWLSQPHEENPALGLRGIRLQLANPSLLEDQLAALLACNIPGGLRIMLPMVSELAEVSEARAVLDRLAGELGRPAPELGIMIETPAAALLAPVLAQKADFFSIGSNDLSQYVQARDRTAASVAAALDGLHPAVLQLIAATVGGAAKHGRWTGLCGGLAADPLAVPVLIGLGVSELSMPPAALAMTKQVIRSLDLKDCRQLAKQALAAPDAASVRAMSRELLEGSR